MQLIDGKATAAAIKEQIAKEVAQIVAQGGKQPHLVAVLVGHDGGSETYVKNKVLALGLIIMFQYHHVNRHGYGAAMHRHCRLTRKLRFHQLIGERKENLLFLLQMVLQIKHALAEETLYFFH